MRIAVIGGGVAGLYAAWHLAGRHEVTLIERNGRIGGHADTHTVDVDPATGPIEVDTGFIVFNPPNYPLFSAWLEMLGVESQPSDMSFGVHCEISGLEYNAASLDRLFCQRRNLLRPAFIGMVRDILRFYKQAPELLERLDERVTLGEWLDSSRLGRSFARDHLVPMAAALWSSPGRTILEFPMRYLLEFMRNHDMLQASNRPVWRTIKGGSQRYVEAALTRFDGRLVTGAAVQAISRLPSGGLRIVCEHGEFSVDHAVLACHADQALALIEAPGDVEREVLGAFEYQPNDTVLHTDANRMPRNRKAWASWNVRRDRDAPDSAGISYYMNSLQNIPGNTPYIVSLNQTDRIARESILVRRSYRHPVYTPASRAAQQRLGEINGVDRLWFCGACWGWGFHEDAVRSARKVVDELVEAQQNHAA
ncbi:MAG: FAD-dependent oxidoreductase [Wenzhouxiangellaceae bacterium]|nr:FAD-dependent oxidoreductase [Wenzhouxiangellaceae bacterium]